jgi:hypothetical protein
MPDLQHLTAAAETCSATPHTPKGVVVQQMHCFPAEPLQHLRCSKCSIMEQVVNKQGSWEVDGRWLPGMTLATSRTANARNGSNVEA